MQTFSANLETKRVLKEDINLILHLIGTSDKLGTYPLTRRGRIMIKMLWEENRSFNQVAEKLSLSMVRVMQIYHLEIRRLRYFFDSTFKELIYLQVENKSLTEGIKELQRKLNIGNAI